MRAMRAKTMRMTYDGVEYAVTVKKDHNLETSIEFRSSHPPRGLHQNLWNFLGRLPKDIVIKHGPST